MFNLSFEPMGKNSTQVHTTTDYSKFKPISGNRNKNLLHINRLKKSMAKNYLFTIIIVNENFEIIDGQHRFDVIQELQLPLHYLICKGYGLAEVQILNQNSKTWNADDYLTGYCQLGYEHYLEYAKFKKRFGFGNNVCMTLLSNNDSGSVIKSFYNGEFKIKDYNKAIDKANKIKLIGKYYDGYKRQTFVRAISQMLDKPLFDFTHFIQKLQIQPLALQNCNDVHQYKLLIEEIYNYRTREKINLRY
jgi:hypothetical protein